MPEFLTLEGALELHAGQIKSYGGSEGLRGSDLLQSAIAQPGVTFGGRFLHTDPSARTPSPGPSQSNRTGLETRPTLGKQYLPLA